MTVWYQRANAVLYVTAGEFSSAFFRRAGHCVSTTRLIKNVAITIETAKIIVPKLRSCSMALSISGVPFHPCGNIERLKGRRQTSVFRVQGGRVECQPCARLDPYICLARPSQSEFAPIRTVNSNSNPESIRIR